MLGSLIEAMQKHFACNLEKLFILNPSTSLRVSWSVIEGNFFI